MIRRRSKLKDVFVPGPRALQERDFQNALLVELSSLALVRGWRINTGVVKTSGGSVVKLAGEGTPDIYGVAWPGLHFEIECKVAPNTVTEKQAKRIAYVRDILGALVFVATARPDQTAKEAAIEWSRRFLEKFEAHTTRVKSLLSVK